MASKAGKDFLDYAASGSDLVKDVKAKKSVKKSERVVLWKFIKKVNPNYRFYRVHAELIKQLQRVIDGTCTRLIIQCPPRHGKSQIASRLLPAAYLLAHPDRTIGLSSYSGEMAEGFSGEARNFFKEGGGLLLSLIHI